MLCLIPLAAAAAWQLLPNDAEQRPFVRVARGNIESSVTALGTLQPRQYVDVGAQASGQIRTLHVEQAEHLLARQQLQRQQRMAADGATRDEDVQTAQAKVLTTQARIHRYQAQILQARASLRSAEAQLGYTRIYAPMSGTVVAVDARAGQTLNAQQRTPLILRIARLSPMTIWAEVSEADIGQVKPGMQAYFTTLSGGGRRWTSTVRQILPIPPKPLDQLSQGGGSPAPAAPSGGTSSGAGRVVLYTVLLDVDNADNALMADMTAQVFFVAGSAQNVLTAPVAALAGKPDQPDQRTAQVLADNGQVQQRAVRIGLSDRLRVQILDGLKEGDRLLIGPTGNGS
ncbi:MAG: efflux RND transporter periplasmic adaptor subunit [Pseudomonas sp.]|nr:efflux RND transporter periplasmic adaptor subunit [Pseudomonas sp.]